MRWRARSAVCVRQVVRHQLPCSGSYMSSRKLLQDVHIMEVKVSLGAVGVRQVVRH
jgi:hypothetical protein